MRRRYNEERFPPCISAVSSSRLPLSVALHAAAKKNTVATAKAENEDLTLTVTLHIDPADIKELIGNDLGGHYMVAEVKVEPKFGKDILLDRDDFQLRTDKDGEKAKPYAGQPDRGHRRA